MTRLREFDASKRLIDSGESSRHSHSPKFDRHAERVRSTTTTTTTIDDGYDSFSSNVSYAYRTELVLYSQVETTEPLVRGHPEELVA